MMVPLSEAVAKKAPDFDSLFLLAPFFGALREA